MTNRVELFIAVVDSVAKPVNQAAGAAAIHGQFNTDKEGFTLIVQTAQTTSAVASVLSITQLTTGAVPFLNITTNTLAGTVTFLKIVADYKTDDQFNTGDLISLAGNAAGIIASFAILAGAPFAASAFTTVAVTAGLLSIYDSALAKAVHEKIAPLFSTLYTHTNAGGDHDYYIAPNLTIATHYDIVTHHQNLIATVDWNPDTSEVKLGTQPLTQYYNNAGGGGQSGAPNGLNSSTPTPTPNGATLTLSIESLNGIQSPDPAPSITVPIDENQDSYACCAGAQQDQYH